MASSIVLERVSKQYGSGRAAVVVLREVDLLVEDGEFVSLMGPSGAGKSTLLHLVAGLDTPTAGRVMVAGAELALLSDDGRSDLRLRSIGIVFQSFNLFPSFTVEENVVWPLEFLGLRAADARARVAAAVDAVGLDPGVLGRRPNELSGGEQQRVAIARALAPEPRVLLADEPTGNLDTATGQLILDLLRGLNRSRGLTVLLVTHDPLAASYGHRTVEVRDGRVVREVRSPREAARVLTLRE